MVPVVLGRRPEDPGRSVASINVVALALLLGSVGLGLVGLRVFDSPIPLVVMIFVGIVLMQAPRIARQWERAVVLGWDGSSGSAGQGSSGSCHSWRACRRGSINGR